MLSVWAGPFAVATLLLGAAGVAKAVDPTMTVGALAAQGLRVPPVLVRLAGAAEAALAVGALLTGAPALAWAVAASYVVFAVFVAVAMARRLPIGSCGCFGKADTPPSAIHLVVNAGAVLSAVAVALGRRGAEGGILDVLAEQPLAGTPFVVLVGVATFLAFASLTVLPQLERITQERTP